MKSPIRSWAFAALSCLFALGTASADPVRVIVGFHGDADAGIFARLGGQAATQIDALGAVAGTIPPGQLHALRRQPGVAYVEEDLVREANDHPVPNDTYYHYTFSNEADGYNDQVGDFALINAPAAWNNSTGAGVRVAVLDSGYDLAHPDAGNVQAARNFTRGGASKVSDSDGHGTHTAGTVAGGTNNNLGVAGTAWDAELAIGKVLGPQGGYDSWIADGMTWAVNPSGGGSRIVSMSLGGTGSSTTLNNACVTVWSSGGITIAAAGNDNEDAGNHYPSAHDDVLSVAAVDESGAWASFSNYGPSVDLAAPGVKVLSTFNNGGYGWASGTSMACPHVAGVAALVLATDSGMFNSELKTRLIGSATLSVDDPRPGTTLIPIIDAAAAVGTVAAPPSVAITSPSPADGETVATVSGNSVTLSADVTKGYAPVSSPVVFYLDEIDPLNEITSPWDTTDGSVPDGEYTIVAQVTDDDGLTGSASVTVTVDNINNDPTVTITSPADNAEVSGTVTLTADASDDRGIASVVFYLGDIDGNPLNVITSPWDTTDGSVPDGQYTIIAEVTDTDGLTGSDSVTITVANTTPPTSLTVDTIDPDSVPAGTNGEEVIITGSGFGDSASVIALNGSGQTPIFTVTSVTSDTITATVSVKSGGPPRDRTWDLSITSGGETVVVSGGFTVTP